MTEATKAPKIENLEVNRETIQDLNEQEGEQVVGGMLLRHTQKVSCPNSCDPTAC